MTDLQAVARQAVDLGVSLIQSIEPGTRTAKTDRDFATEADYLLEREIKHLLADLTPDIPFVGEEYGGRQSAGTYWCLDPIDGTLNYSRGIPLHGISLALVTDGMPVIGEIALPSLNERYATGASGPTLNGQPISVSHVTTLGEAVVSVGDFATGTGSVAKNQTRLATVSSLADKVQRIRMVGSAATDLAWLAAGRIDAVIMHSNNTWDMAAGVAIARQAGAHASTISGDPYNTNSTSLLVGNRTVHAHTVDLLMRWNTRRGAAMTLVAAKRPTEGSVAMNAERGMAARAPELISRCEGCEVGPPNAGPSTRNGD